jgi:multidrug resistance efflux pump
MQASLLLLALALNGPSAPRAVAAPENPILHDCLVTLIEDVPVPGREAAEIVALEAKEGMLVKKGMVLGKLDDSLPKAQLRVKMAEWGAANEKAKDDINIRFADASAKVAYAELEKALESNKTAVGAITAVEINRLRLAHEKSRLQIEQAALEKKVDTLTATMKSSEVDLAKLSIQRRHIVAPFDGVVVNVYKHLGEWVALGDPVLRIVRMDKLRVKGAVNASHFKPAEIQGRAVVVRVALERGSIEEFPGKIVYVSPLVENGIDYEVFAEVENRMDNNHFVLLPGLNAEMTIVVNGDLARR